MARKPSLPEIIDACIDRRLEGVHTATVGQIRSYDADTVTAVVRTALPDTDDLRDVPVAFPGNWSSGDPVVVVFGEREFDDDLADTGEERRHSLRGVAIPIVARAGDDVDFVALAQKVVDRLEAMQDAIDNHTHAGVTTGAGVSGVPTPIVWPVSSVAAVKLKAR